VALLSLSLRTKSHHRSFLSAAATDVVRNPAGGHFSPRIQISAGGRKMDSPPADPSSALIKSLEKACARAPNWPSQLIYLYSSISECSYMAPALVCVWLAAPDQRGDLELRGRQRRVGWFVLPGRPPAEEDKSPDIGKALAAIDRAPAAARLGDAILGNSSADAT